MSSTTTTSRTSPDRTWERALADLLATGAAAPDSSLAALGRTVLALETAAGAGLGDVCGDPVVVLQRRLARAAGQLPAYALSIDDLRRHSQSLQGGHARMPAPCPALAAPAAMALVAC